MNSERKRLSAMALVGLLVGIVAIGLVTASAAGYRGEWWHFTTSIQLFEWATYVAGIALLLALVGAFRARPGGARRGFTLALVGLALALPLAAAGLQWKYTAAVYPPINDVTTDAENPPAFWDVPNPITYPGPETAALQREAYPDLKPLEMSRTPEETFEIALAVARDMGWEVIAADPMDGRIEAVDATPLFGFKDNVAVRVTPSNGHARLDVRSHSRLGRIDRGVNAKRIRRYLSAVQGAAQ